MTLLEVDDAHAGYGEFATLHGVSLRLQGGETLAVIAPTAPASRRC